ncbi:MAG TPA: DNRLRE domain-containing protein, partial [Syntrophomonadaceae bacterium]|nr:DNRLRE domain-containing protein [Syntrophomonadaceae bacterium]
MAILTFLPIDDAYVSEWYADQNFGSSTALFVGRFMQPGDLYRSLLRFDLSTIPPTSTINSAELNLTMYRNEIISGSQYVGVYHLLSDWNESTVTWNNQPPFSLTPFCPVWDAAIAITPSTPLGRITIDITDLVNSWFNGSIPNSGLLLAGNETVNDLVGFRSLNYQYNIAWPMLTVNFMEGILETYPPEQVNVPNPPALPMASSSPIPLGARDSATFLISNASDSTHVEAMIQVGLDNDPAGEYFNAGPWNSLEPNGQIGDSIALFTNYDAEYTRVLVQGQGGETV